MRGERREDDFFLRKDRSTRVRITQTRELHRQGPGGDIPHVARSRQESLCGLCGELLQKKLTEVSCSGEDRPTTQSEHVMAKSPKNAQANNRNGKRSQRIRFPASRVSRDRLYRCCGRDGLQRLSQNSACTENRCTISITPEILRPFLRAGHFPDRTCCSPGERLSTIGPLQRRMP